MSELWYKELGFSNNPFSIKPVKFNDELIGLEEKVKDIIKLIKKGKIVFITGDYGRGKTSVLKKIIKNFSGKRKVAYFSGNQIDRYIDVDRVLINAGGVFSRLFKIRSDEVILLLDEVQDMNQNDIDEIIEAYEEGYFKSVVVVSASDTYEKTNERFGGLISKERFELNGFSEEDAIELVRKRVGKIELLSDEIIKMIYKEDKNPRSILKNCEDLCRYAIENGDERVKEEHIQKVI